MRVSGETMLHLAARCENEKAGLFLVNNGANCSAVNHMVGNHGLCSHRNQRVFVHLVELFVTILIRHTCYLYYIWEEHLAALSTKWQNRLSTCLVCSTVWGLTMRTDPHKNWGLNLSQAVVLSQYQVT